MIDHHPGFGRPKGGLIALVVGVCAGRGPESVPIIAAPRSIGIHEGEIERDAPITIDSIVTLNVLGQFLEPG